MQHKKASTPLPLSPEETQEASQLFGRSLFSALQLAKEQERRKLLERQEMFKDDGTLRIPIPASMLPVRDKMAQDHENPEELHVAKAPLALLGGIAGGGAGAALRNQSRGFMHGTKRTLQGGLLGTAAGLSGGALLDALINEKIKKQQDGSLAWRENAAQEDALAKLKQEEAARQMQLDLNSAPEKIGSSEGYGDSPGLFARAFRTSNEPLRMLSGGQEGFSNAKRDYYMQERAKIQQELMDAQKEYINTLSRIKTGSAEIETPCVDAFCNGIAHTTLFGKTADFQEPEIEEDAIKRLLSDTLGVAKKPFQPAMDAAATGLVGTAAGGAYLTYLLRKKMREEPEKYMSESLPTRVELEPYA